MLGTNDERVFLRSFVLFFITTVLCPSTYNFVDPKYLYSLRDRDIMGVEYRDFGTLCLNHLFEEMDNWKNKKFMNVGDFNRMSWIGGCLPILGVVYIDFVDFDGNAGTIYYRLPRMSYIKNADFAHLHKLDRNKFSHKVYGVLPIRDISLTPYGGPMFIPSTIQSANNIGDIIELGQPIEVSSTDESDGSRYQNASLSDHVGSEDEYGMGNFHEALNVRSPANYVVEPKDFCNDPVAVSFTGIDGITNIPESSAPAETHVGKVPKFANHVVQSDDLFDMPVSDSPVDANGLSNFPGGSSNKSPFSIGDGLLNIAMCYVEAPSEHESPIAEGFVSQSSSENNVLRTEGGAKTALTDVINPSFSPKENLIPNQIIGSVSTVRQNVCESSSGQINFDKKNRKKCAAKTRSPDQVMPKLIVNSDVVSFYTKFMRDKYFSRTESPIFFQFEGCSITYETFYTSFKTRGNVADDAICAYAEVFNEESKNAFVKKFMFSPFVAVRICPQSFKILF